MVYSPCCGKVKEVDEAVGRPHEDLAVVEVAGVSAPKK